MRIEGESFIDLDSGHWYGIICIVHDDGHRGDILRTPPIFPTRTDAEKAIIDKARNLAGEW